MGDPHAHPHPQHFLLGEDQLCCMWGSKWAWLAGAGVIVAGKSVPGLRQQKQIGSSELGMDLQKARHDSNVKAVVLRVDSPGTSHF